MSGAIETVYDAFAHYERPKTFPACSCCIPDASGRYGDGKTVDIPAPGGHTPLREITADDLCAFAENVPGTCGDTASYKHYLPRILELAERVDRLGEDEFPSLGDVLPRLAYRNGFTPWWEWIENERDAIRQYMHSHWRSVCASSDAGELSDLLGGLLNTDPDVDPYLESWAAAPVDRLVRVETISWIERPSAEFGPEFARANWTKVRDWVYAQN